MKKVWVYSGLLVIGLVLSQLIDFNLLTIPFGSEEFDAYRVIGAITMICMGYIMLEVGLEFTLDKKNLKQYGGDSIVALGAAAIPWALCTLYYFSLFPDSLPEAILLGGFAAPTSAGILFTMLAAAGLSASWVFKKARILAIFDDLATVILIVPAMMLIQGWNPMMIWGIVIMLAIMFFAYKNLHRYKMPVTPGFMLFYAVIIWGINHWLDSVYHIHIGVLLPAFCLGCVAKFDHNEGIVGHEKKPPVFDLDNAIKIVFMLGVGLSMPMMQFGVISVHLLIIHVVAITVLSNLGKLFIVFCYRKTAKLNDRFALSVAMFPRGEVGAGILLLSLAYGNDSITTTLSGVCLGLNLLLTGVFITIVKKSMSPTKKETEESAPLH